MAVNPGSRLRGSRKVIFGWKDGDNYCLSLGKRGDGMPVNRYATALDAVQESSYRHIPIEWEDPSVVR